MNEQAKKNFIINFVFISLWAFLIYIISKFLLKYLFPFILAFTVAALMQRPSGYIHSRTAIKKGLLAAALSALLYVTVAALLCLLLYKSVGIFSGLFSEISQLSQKLYSVIIELEMKVSRMFDLIPQEIRVKSREIVGDMISSMSLRITEFISSFAANTAKATPSFLFSSAVALVATCYIAKDYDRLMNFIKELCGNSLSQKIIKIKSIFRQSILHFAKGYFILMLITFAELFLGFLVLGIKNAFIKALLTAFVDLLPVLGTGTVLLPWGLLNIATGNITTGFGIIILYILIAIVRNFAEPKIIGQKIGIYPLFTLILMFVGLKIFGVIGVFLLPVIFIVVFKYYKQEIS